MKKESSKFKMDMKDKVVIQLTEIHIAYFKLNKCLHKHTVKNKKQFQQYLRRLIVLELVLSLLDFKKQLQFNQ